MSVQKRILLSLLLVSAVFAGALYFVRQDQAEYFRRVIATREKDWRDSVTIFLQRQQRPQAVTVGDLASDLKVVAGLEFSDREQLAAALDDRTLKSRGLHAVWVYRPDGSLLYAHALATAAQVLDAQPLPEVKVAELVARKSDPHFHFELPGAATEGTVRRFVEVRGSPVVAKVENADGSPRVIGHLFAGCLLDRQEVGEMPLLHPDDHIELVSARAQAPAETTHTMTLTAPLLNWEDRPIGQLVVWNNSRELTELERRGERHFIAIVGAALMLFGLLLLSLSGSIVRPLKLIIKGLDDGDVAAIVPLARQRSEIGTLAETVVTHVQQSAAFVKEMQTRVAAQEALRESEEMLRHSQKLEAVGRLAGGVAHDFNNLLTAIIGYASLLETRLAGDREAREHAALIHQAGEQAAGLTRQLLAFSRKQLLQPRLIDLNAVVCNLQRLLQRIIGEHIEISTEPRSATGCVRADPGQIEQVVINLGVNARDAMPRGGRLTIRTMDAELGEVTAEVNLPAGRYVAIEVTDTGEGMDHETRARIFEPFFTTKGPGKGTGLGLATVYGIVKQSGGEIVVESERGVGSTFRIYLPMQDGAPEVQETKLVRAPRHEAGESVLVVEDEEIVRELICEVLSGEGYRVTGTDRGSDALRMVRDELGAVDLLISDVVMPEMNGAVVARRVRELSPRVKVLFVSGYSENDMADQGLEALAFEVLQKPFTPEQLAGKVRDILDESGH
ncbi:MAG: response regulator [Chthoniobacteraceae bacterium]